MGEFFHRLALRPGLTVLLLLASFAISVLVLAPPVFVMQVLNRYVAFGVDGTLIALATGALFAVGMEFLLRWARLRLSQAASVTADDRLAARFGEALATLRLSVFESVRIEQKRRLAADLALVQAAYAPSAMAVMLDLPFTALLILVLFVIDPLLALVAVAICGLVVGWALVARVATVSANRRSEDGGRPGTGPSLEDALNGAATVRAFNAASPVVRNWRLANRRQQARDRSLSLGQGVQQAVTQAAAGLTTIAVIGVGAVLVVQQKIDVGVLIAANILAARAVAGVAAGVAQAVPLARARAALKRLAVLERQEMEALDNRKSLDDFSGRIEVEDVTFAYPGATKPLVEHLSLRLEPGQILVVHGGNGAGKTSLAEVLMGLRDPLRGAVLIDGVDLRQVSPIWWRRQVCYLPQQAHFLNLSIADNLRVLNPELDDAALSRAIQAAGARDLVARLKDGLDTVLENHGMTLTPGERKRLAIARALTGQGRLVLFDEPLEGMDAAGKAAVAALIQSFAASGRTIIVCSSDPDLVRQADWRLDLDRKPTPVPEKGPGRSAVQPLQPQSGSG